MPGRASTPRTDGSPTLAPPLAAAFVLLAAALAPLLWLALSPALAGAACDLEPGPRVRVAGVIDAETVALADGGEVRLIGLRAPEPLPSWRREEPWPPARDAARALEDLLAVAGDAELRFAGPRQDRHGRWLAHLFVKDGDGPVWVQGRLVEQGAARAISFADHRACARTLQALEAEARNGQRGLWRWRVYAVVPAAQTETLLKRLNSLQIVEGRVHAVSRTGRWTFLNFDADWRRDFTVAIAAADRRRFKGSDIDLETLEGRRVRVRGWIESWNGPAIKVTHPEQLEPLDRQGENQAAMEGFEMRMNAPHCASLHPGRRWWLWRRPQIAAIRAPTGQLARPIPAPRPEGGPRSPVHRQQAPFGPAAVPRFFGAM